MVKDNISGAALENQYTGILPGPDVLAVEIAENLESVLDSFRGLMGELNGAV